MGVSDEAEVKMVGARLVVQEKFEWEGKKMEVGVLGTENKKKDKLSMCDGPFG